MRASPGLLCREKTLLLVSFYRLLFLFKIRSFSVGDVSPAPFTATRQGCSHPRPVADDSSRPAGSTV